MREGQQLRSADWVRIGTLAVVSTAILLRLWHFATARSLWTDEAMIAVNIVHLPTSALLGPLYFNQLAPVGWLLLEKASLLLSPNFDYSLRLVALAGGVASVLLFWRFMKSIADPWETLAGSMLFGLSSMLIQYSAMVKPYILDALFAIALLWLAVALIRRPEKRLGLTACFALTGLACIPLAFGGTIAMAGTGIVLFTAAIVQRDWRWVGALAATGLAWLAVFAELYLLFYGQHDATIGNMTNRFWVGAFAPLPTSFEAIRWYPVSIASALSFLLAGMGGIIVTALFLLGCYCIGRRDKWLLALLLSSFPLALLASATRAYPFESRFLLFVAPPLSMVVAAALAAIARSFRTPVLGAVALLVLVGAKPLLLTAASAAQLPAWPMEEVKSNLAYLSHHRKPGDRLFLNQAAERPFLLYARRFGLEDMPYQVLNNYSDDPRCINEDVRRIATARPAWVIFYHMNDAQERGLAFMENILRQDGPAAATDPAPGSILEKFEGPPSSATAGTLPVSASPLCTKPRDGQAFLASIAAEIRN